MFFAALFCVYFAKQGTVHFLWERRGGGGGGAGGMLGGVTPKKSALYKKIREKGGSPKIF